VDCAAEPAFGCAREFFGPRYVYVVFSPRAHGLSLGVNLNPDKRCNFNCVYCEVDRRVRATGTTLDLSVLAAELESALNFVESRKLCEQPPYSRLPAALLRLRQVAISGDGEPTLSPQFREAIETIAHVRATSGGRFFKMVLITNASNLDAAAVQEGLQLFTRDDEIWAKLDVGTQAQMDWLNKSEVPLEKILSNILLVARQRPVVIQSLFPALDGCGPGEPEIERYAQRLNELSAAGAQISLVQIYSATRPAMNPHCGHLSLRALSHIAQTVRNRTGLNIEIF
jgi:wyosine [tRNA(Phe)-imidazoG37] synthetase (radical SAM superfamily)